ncbi:MAG: DUF4416 family protein [Candidatus Omnitrophica bacterium]|nr:DUF4416 family protein [Candidatus Omnitrophota bacterium]
MLKRILPLPVKFICGFIYSNETSYTKSIKILERKFGKIDLESSRFDFGFTSYYEKEMGAPLYRRFVSFEKLRDAVVLPAIKIFCIKIEKKFAKNNKRTINIDPGYINEGKLVLTTTKDYYHRIYAGKGIFEEVTLYYKGSNFQDFPTTYPDYKTPEYKEIFLLIRENYRKQLKGNAK